MWTSLGISVALFPFLNQYEVIRLQTLNRFNYEAAVSRVQVRINTSNNQLSSHRWASAKRQTYWNRLYQDSGHQAIRLSDDLNHQLPLQSKAFQVMNELLGRLQNNLEWFKLCFNKNIGQLSPQEMIIFSKPVVVSS